MTVPICTRRWLSAVSLALVLGGVVALPAAAAPPTVVMVDDDGMAAIGDCDASRRTYRHLQGAIEGAPNGATMLVCPGTYNTVASKRIASNVEVIDVPVVPAHSEYPASGSSALAGVYSPYIQKSGGSCVQEKLGYAWYVYPTP